MAFWTYYVFKYGLILSYFVIVGYDDIRFDHVSIWHEGFVFFCAASVKEGVEMVETGKTKPLGDQIKARNDMDLMTEKT